MPSRLLPRIPRCDGGPISPHTDPDPDLNPAPHLKPKPKPKPKPNQVRRRPPAAHEEIRALLAAKQSALLAVADL